MIASHFSRSRSCWTWPWACTTLTWPCSWPKSPRRTPKSTSPSSTTSGTWRTKGTWSTPSTSTWASTRRPWDTLQRFLKSLPSVWSLSRSRICTPKGSRSLRREVWNTEKWQSLMGSSWWRRPSMWRLGWCLPKRELFLKLCELTNLLVVGRRQLLWERWHNWSKWLNYEFVTEKCGIKFVWCKMMERKFWKFMVEVENVTNVLF